MKINGIPIRVENDTVIELEKGDRIRLTSPSGLGRTCLYLEVNSAGKLNITGGSEIVGKISGLGMRQKVSLA